MINYITNISIEVLTLRGKICDLSEVSQIMMTEEDMSHLTALKHGAYLTNPNIKFAYISTDAKILELINYAKTITEYELETFPTTDEAKSWISNTIIKQRKWIKE